MTYYTVDLKITKSEIIEANSFKEAAAKAKEMHRDFRLDCIYNNSTGEESDCIMCEVCGEFIDDQESAGSDEDGNDYCAGCIAAIKEDMEKYPEQYKQDYDED